VAFFFVAFFFVAFFFVAFFFVALRFGAFLLAAFFFAFFFVAMQRSPGRAVRRAMKALYIGGASDNLKPTMKNVFHLHTIT
jgi:hypothetical protein